MRARPPKILLPGVRTRSALARQRSVIMQLFSGTQGIWDYVYGAQVNNSGSPGWLGRLAGIIIPTSI